MQIVRGAWCMADGTMTRLAGHEMFDRNLDFHGTGIRSYLQYRTCGNRETRRRVATWDTRANGLGGFGQLVETDVAGLALTSGHDVGMCRETTRGDCVCRAAKDCIGVRELVVVPHDVHQKLCQTGVYHGEMDGATMDIGC